MVQKQQPIDPSAYQESLDAGMAAPELTTSSVRYWSDFSRVFYHPRSIVQLNEYELNSSLMPFEKWSMGEELFSSLDKDHDIVDRDLRPFIEEADHMQGIQIMAGIDDAWGGFASKYLERLRDEYGKIPIWVWGLQEPTAGLARVCFYLHTRCVRRVINLSPGQAASPTGQQSTRLRPHVLAGIADHPSGSAAKTALEHLLDQVFFLARLGALQRSD